MQIDIEKYDNQSNYSEAFITSTWQSLEEWFLSNNETIEKLENADFADDSPPIDAKDSSMLWEEMQAYLYLFRNSIDYLIKFKSRTRQLILLLSPILRDLPNFNTDPRYVKDETAIQNIHDIANSILNTNRNSLEINHEVNKFYEAEKIPEIIKKLSELPKSESYLEDSTDIKIALNISDFDDNKTSYTNRIERSVKIPIYCTVLALSGDHSQAEEEYYKLVSHLDKPRVSLDITSETDILKSYIEKAIVNNSNNNSYNWSEIYKSIVQTLEEKPKPREVIMYRTIIIFFLQRSLQIIFECISKNMVANDKEKDVPLISN